MVKSVVKVMTRALLGMVALVSICRSMREVAPTSELFWLMVMMRCESTCVASVPNISMIAIMRYIINSSPKSLNQMIS